MIKALDRHTKATLAQKRHDFVPVGNVVLDVNAIISFRVIETEIVIFLFACRLDIVFFGFRFGFYFFGSLPEVINLRKV